MPLRFVNSTDRCVWVYSLHSRRPQSSRAPAAEALCARADHCHCALYNLVRVFLLVANSVLVGTVMCPMRD